MSVETFKVCGFEGGYAKLFNNISIPNTTRRIVASSPYNCFHNYTVYVRIDENGVPLYFDYAWITDTRYRIDIPSDIPLSNPVVNILFYFRRPTGIYDTYCSNELTLQFQDSVGNVLKTLNFDIMAYRSTITYIGSDSIVNCLVIKYDDYASARLESFVLRASEGVIDMPHTTLFPGILYVREYDANDNLLRISKAEMYLPEIKPLPTTRKIVVTPFAQGNIFSWFYELIPHPVAKCIG
jgi:hypothetical protein